MRRPPRPGLRVRILGPLEARLTESDRVVLGGLVEGTWPPESNTDAWLSRPMRLELGLDLPERRIGLTAHDFAQLLGAREVILSHAAKIAGTPTVPSRFIQRLAAVAGARWQDGHHARRELSRLGARTRPARDASQPAPQPAPTPPRAARPKSLSVTEIEHWLRDPYTIYAKHILRLRPLDAVDTEPGAAERGTIIHAAIGDFTQNFAKDLPADPARELIALGEPHFRRARGFSGGARLLVAALRAHRALVRALGSRAARRDRRARRRNPRRDRDPARATARSSCAASPTASSATRDGRYVILDYKTGAARTEKQVRTGLAPQLTLEAAILRQGGFADIPAGASVAEIVYVLLKGGEPPGESEIDRVQGRHAGQPGRSRAGKAHADWRSASTTRASPTARWSIRCGGRITAITIISRASRNGRAPAARSTTSGAANENAGRHSAAGPASCSARSPIPNVSAWVAANAGSGKTHVLAQRVINLLLEGRRAGKNPLHHLHQGGRRQHGEARVRHARRMDHARRRRARRRDPRAARAWRPTPRGARWRGGCSPARWKRPGGLKVQTIHAFCTQLLHQFPFEANVAARFTVLDETEQTQLLERLTLDVLLDGAATPDGPLGRALATAMTAAADQTLSRRGARRDRPRATPSRAGSSSAGGIEPAIAALSRALGVDPAETRDSIEEEFFAGSLDCALGMGRASPPRWRKAARPMPSRRAASACLHRCRDPTASQTYLDIFCTATSARRANRSSPRRSRMPT